MTEACYSNGFKQGGSVTVEKGIGLEVVERDVLIVDDIIDTGRTLGELTAMVRAQGAKSVSTVALISKTSRRSAEAEAEGGEDPEAGGQKQRDEAAESAQVMIAVAVIRVPIHVGIAIEVGVHVGVRVEVRVAAEIRVMIEVVADVVIGLDILGAKHRLDGQNSQAHHQGEHVRQSHGERW